MRPTDSDGLDQQINEAARALTDGSPRADFKARVLARIDKQGGGLAETGHNASVWSLGGAWAQSRFALIAASVAVAGAAIAISLHIWPPPPAPIVSSSAPAVARVGAQPPAAPIAAVVKPSPQLVVRPSQPTALPQTEAATPIDTGPEAASPDLAVNIAPLQPASIDIAPLQVDIIRQLMPIGVEDLSVQAIHVLPLDAQDVLNQ
jgi:hypothetical protein